MAVFNREDSKYKYFWGAVHVEHATMVISILALVLIFRAVVSLALASTLISLIFNNFGLYFAFALVASAYVAVIVGIMLAKPQFFLPCLFCQGLFLAYRFVCFLLFLVGSSWNNKVMEDPDVPYKIVAFIYEICIFDIYMKCYKYYTDKAAAAANEVVLPMSEISVTTVPKEVEASL